LDWTGHIKHYTIPIFIPELGCPFRCVFCDQEKITSRGHVPDSEEVGHIISQYHKSFPRGEKHIEIGFFGGNFTGLALEEQERFLKVALPYLQKGTVQGIRLSTRPDYITDEKLDLLEKYGVTTVELGAQSLVDEVLVQSARGHTADDVGRASRMIRDRGFRLGLQMMIGLPGDSLEKALFTARRIAELGAAETRIYPALVIRGTKLEEWYRSGVYTPLSLEEAVHWLAELIPVLENADVAVTRVGLHSSIGHDSGKELIAGPFHPSIRELAMTEIWWNRLSHLVESAGTKSLRITVHPSQYNFATGYAGKNRKKLQKHFGEVVFEKKLGLKNNELEIEMTSHAT
jgi:histone acetyltransferase (RNA polymerase elongator complex component)